MAALGFQNKINACFLAGLDKLPVKYRGEVSELGFVLRDISKWAAKEEARLPLLVEAYKAWGGIKHLGLLIFLIMSKIFGKRTSIATFYGGMIINYLLTEIKGHSAINFLF